MYLKFDTSIKNVLKKKHPRTHNPTPNIPTIKSKLIHQSPHLSLSKPKHKTPGLYIQATTHHNDLQTCLCSIYKIFVPF